MDKLYFFFDIDGTLSDNATKKIVPSAKLALDKLQEKGHFVAIATGRAHYKALPFMQAVGLKNMVCNGGYGMVIDGRLVENKPLDRKLALAICKQAEQLGLGLLIAIDDSKDVYSKEDTFIQQVGYRKEPTRYIFDRSMRYEEVENFYKIYVAIDKEQEDILTLKDTLGHLRFVDTYLMFQNDNKKAGIEKMVTRMGGNLANVVVFGDDYNDLNMFDSRWCNVAMKNGCQELKDRADYVADSNVNDGIYKICIAKGWIDEAE